MLWLKNMFSILKKKYINVIPDSLKCQIYDTNNAVVCIHYYTSYCAVHLGGHSAIRYDR